MNFPLSSTQTNSAMGWLRRCISATLLVLGFSLSASAMGDVLKSHGGITPGSLGTESKIRLRTVEPRAPGVSELLREIKVDSVGDLIILSGANPRSSQPTYSIEKTSGTSGNRIWTISPTDLPSLSGQSVIIAISAGNDVITTRRFPTNTYGTSEIEVSKFSGDSGAKLWKRSLLIDTNDFISLLSAKSSFGGDVTLGLALDGGDDQGETRILRLSGATGNTLWEYWSDNGLEEQDIEVDAQGNVLVLGNVRGLVEYTDSFGQYQFYHYENKFFITKLRNSSGQVSWTAASRHPFIEPVSLTADLAGNVIAIGQIGQYNNNFPKITKHNIYTVKFSAATGVILWESEYNSSLDLNDRASAVWTDPQGNVFVIGQSDQTSRPYDFSDRLVICKYSGASGAAIWTRRYDIPSTLTTAAVDHSGDIFVAGRESSTNHFQARPFCRKYQGLDGTLLSQQSLEFDELGWEYIHSLGLDPNGNCFVAGGTATQENILKLGWSLQIGQMEVRIKVEVIDSHFLQRSADLRSWSNHQTVWPGRNGIVQYIDTTPPANAGFYRLRRTGY